MSRKILGRIGREEKIAQESAPPSPSFISITLTRVSLASFQDVTVEGCLTTLALVAPWDLSVQCTNPL